MTRFFRGLVFVLVFVSLVRVPIVHADWEANFVATGTKHDFPRAAGRLYAKGERIRLDATAPMEMNLYVKTGATLVDATVPSFHIRLSADLSRFSGQVPACLGEAFEVCVKKFNLKKVRKEKCGGTEATRDCEVYEGGASLKDVKKLTLWHWKGEREPIVSQSVIVKKDGSEIHTTFTKIARTTRDAAFFEVPSGFMNAGSLEAFLGDIKGKSQ